MRTDSPLQPNCIYHIFNHAIGSDNLFKTEENYSFFLQRYAFHINKIADTYAYCLMPNHIHFVVKIKSLNELILLPDFKEKYTIEYFNSKKFSNLFSSYAQSFNKQQNRKGNLFISNFERRIVANQAYFRNLINYVHMNPVNHGFVKDPADWKFSSYWSLLSEAKTHLQRETVQELFSNHADFIKMHKEMPNEKFLLDMNLP
jgi:REP element-mobilizing transposase RayT